MPAPIDGIPDSVVSAPTSAPTSAFGSAVPVWLLDVDGVLNVNRPGWGGPPRQANAYADGRAWRLRWAARLLDRIRALHLSGAVEVRWCTTWCPQADQLETLMRLPQLARTLTAEQVVSQAVSWPAKLEVAATVVEVERRPLIWTDDEAITAAGVAGRLRLAEAGMPIHLVEPRSNRGLREEHLAEIEEFAAACAGVGGAGNPDGPED